MFGLVNKKGAMFGLDARIALAIFGALSVISGAALYSAIQNSVIVSYIASVNELEKSVEQYLLDTGEYPTLQANDYFGLEKLVVDPTNVTNWNGPYISLEVSNSRYLDLGKIGVSQIGVNYAKGDSWNTRIPCTSMGVNDKCSLWIASSKIEKSLTEKIELFIDGEIDDDTGNFRFKCDTSGIHAGKCIAYHKMSISSDL